MVCSIYVLCSIVVVVGREHTHSTTSNLYQYHLNTMEKFNVIYCSLFNEYGSKFGETRVSFPTVEITVEELTQRLPSGELKNDLINRSEYCPLRYEEVEPQDWGYGSQDLWSQERSASATSLEDALEMYYAE